MNSNSPSSILVAQTTPKSDADLCMRVDLPLDKKTVENQDWVAGPPLASGPPGHLARPRFLIATRKLLIFLHHT